MAKKAPPAQVLHLVQGNTGLGADNREWTVCAYEDEALAQKHAEKANQAARRIQRLGYWSPEAKAALKSCVWDEKMGMDPTGTDYVVVPVAVRSSLPEET